MTILRKKSMVNADRRDLNATNIAEFPGTTPDASAAADFLNRLWRYQSGQYFCISSRHRDDDGKVGLKNHWFEKNRFNRIVAKVAELMDDNNVWFCPHGFNFRERTKVTKKGGEPNAVLSDFLYADADDVDPRDAEVPPTAVIQSSPGRFVGLWHLSDAAAPWEVNQKWTKLNGYDIGGWDPTQVLRLPGTINHKRGPRVITQLIDFNYNRHKLREFTRLLPRDRPTGGGEVSGDIEVPAAIAKRLKEGPQLNAEGKLDRSGWMSGMAKDMLRANMMADDVFSTLWTSKFNKHAGQANGKEYLRKLIRKAKRWVANEQQPELDPGQGMTARELQKEPDVELEYILDGFFPEGTSILCGKPKAGKSLMAMHLAIATATGGETLGVQCEKGDVLYIVLEGGKRQLRRRLKLFLGDDVKWPRNITFYTQFPRFDEGALKFVRRWLDASKKPRLVVVDTLAAVKARVAQQTTTTDYDSVAPFTRLLEDYPGVGGVIVAHTRKASSDDDPILELSGTLGTAAAVNTINVIRREGSKTLFYGRGHELEEFNKVIELQFPHWRILGDEGKVTTADNPRKILDALQDGRQELGPKGISAKTGLSDEIVKTTLGRMLKTGLVRKSGRGKYVADC